MGFPFVYLDKRTHGRRNGLEFLVLKFFESKCSRCLPCIAAVRVVKGEECELQNHLDYVSVSTTKIVVMKFETLAPQNKKKLNN